MIVRLLYKEKVVGESDDCKSHITRSYGLDLEFIIQTLMDKFGIDFSHYCLSDMRQSPNKLDFLLKEEDYIKLRDDKINKILSE